MMILLNSIISMYKIKLILSFFLLFYSCSNNLKVLEKPLNVVWISCEDMGPILGSYGNDIIKTPNLDKLASEGVRYTNAYSTVGVCAPSRFSIITGMYSARLGAHNMRAGDYHNYKTPEQVSYRKNIGVIDKEGKNIPEYEVVPPTYVKPFTEILRTNGYYCANNFKCDYQFNAPFTAWDEVSSTVSYRDAPKDKPFFYVWNTLLTHESRIWERSNQPLTVNPEDIIIPSYFPDIPEVRNDIARKYSNIEAMDKKVGELISQLEEDGLLENTIIMFWSDHGGNLLRQKRAVGNSGLNVPLIIRYPNKMDAGKVDNRIVSLMDLGPTRPGSRFPYPRSSSMLKMDNDIQFYFKQNCKQMDDVLSHNVIGEITGSEFPDEYILVGGHLDSWDIGDGSHDDGAGCVQSMDVLRLLKVSGITPKRSIRVVLFMNEENGLRGGKKYAEEAFRKGENHIFALESDAGAFTPRGFYFDTDESNFAQILSWKELFKPYLIHFFELGGSGADIGPLKTPYNVLSGLKPDSQRYFDHHHSANDVF